MSNNYGWAQAGGDIGGAIIGAISANVQNKKSFKYQSALQAQAAKLNYDYSLKSAENMPSSTRKGLETAGYNPMLAVQNSTSGANSSWTSAGNFQSADYSNAITQGIANAQAYQRLKNETTVSESTTDKNIADADEAKARKLEILERLPWVSKKMKAEIGQLEGEAQLMEAQRHYMNEQVAIQQAGITVQQEANANQAEYNRILKNSSPSGKSQSFRNYTDGVRNIFSGIGDIIHGRNDNYENYTETREVTNGPKGRSQEKVTSKRSGRRKKR